MAINSTSKSRNEKLVISDIRQKITFSIAESYKNTRTNVISLMAKKNAKTLAISSPNASEGKSTTSLNLAITISQLGKKVLIIDADTHRPSLHQKLKIDNSTGILELIAGEVTLKDAIYTHNEYLDVLTCNASSSNPSEILSSESFDNLLETFKNTYDYIILDTPPINPISDALVIAQKVDVFVLVVRASSTTYDAFNKAFKALKLLDLTIDGVIINGADPRPKGYYKSKYSYYKNSKYYY